MATPSHTDSKPGSSKQKTCDTTAIIAGELAREIRSRFGIDVEAVGSLYYDLTRPIKRSSQVGNLDELTNSYTIAGQGFSISVEPDHISLTVHKGDPTTIGPTELENASSEKWATAIAQLITIDDTLKYDLNDPKSIDAVLDKLGEILDGQV